MSTLSLNGITTLGNVKARSIGLINATGTGYDDVRTLIAAGGGSGAVTSATTPLTITSGVLAIDLTTYATNAAVATSVNTAINNYATTDASQLTAALALKQNNIISSTDIVAQDVTLRFLTGGNASSAFVLNSGNVLTVFKDNANNSLLSLSNAVSTFSTGVTFEDVIAFRKTISISDTANSLTGQLYIATGNKLKWQGKEVVTTDVMFADRIAKMQFDTAFSVVTQAATGGLIIAKNQSFQNSIVKFAGSTNSLRNVTSNSVDYLTWGADYLATIPYVTTQLALKQNLLAGVSQTSQNTIHANTTFLQHSLTIKSHPAPVSRPQAQIFFEYASGAQTQIWANSTSLGFYAPASTAAIHLYTSAGIALQCNANSLNVVVGGSLSQSSDKRLKDDIEDADIEKCVKLLDQISVKTYRRNDFETNKTRIGFIANDWQDAIPPEFQNIVSCNTTTGGIDGEDVKEDLLGLDYSRITCVLWGICKNQQKQIDELIAKVNA